MQKKLVWIVILLMVVVFSIPNFGRSNGFTDSKYYMDFAKYLRGEQKKDTLEPPFSFRPLVPFLASLLPFPLDINFGIINTVAIALSCVILFKFLKKLEFNEKESFVGVLLFLASYPVFLYFPAILTDSVGFLFLLWGIYLIFTDSLWFFIVASFAILAREVNIALLGIYFLKNSGLNKKHLLLVLPILAFVFARLILGKGLGYFWHPTTVNLLRPEAYVHFVLGLGFLIPPLIAFVFDYRSCRTKFRKSKYYNFLIYTLAILMLIPIYGFIAGYFDSRYVIVMYPVLIPFAIVGIGSVKTKFWK